MAYASKYYDPQKAHEYYLKRRQLKGRKKATSIADLNEAGKIAAQEVKERLNEELKAALKKVKKGNTAERKRLRELYKKKYEAELAEIRKDPAMIKASNQKASKGSSSKGTSSKGSSSGSSSSKGSSSSGAKKKATTKAAQDVEEVEEVAEEAVEEPTEKERIADAIAKLRASFPQMSDKQRVEAYKLIKKLIKKYNKMHEG